MKVFHISRQHCISNTTYPLQWKLFIRVNFRSIQTSCATWAPLALFEEAQPVWRRISVQQFLFISGGLFLGPLLDQLFPQVPHTDWPKLISTVCNLANQYVIFNFFPKQIVLNIFQSQSGRDTAAGTYDYSHFRKSVSPKNLQMKYEQAPAQYSSSASNRFSSSFLAFGVLILSL